MQYLLSSHFLNRIISVYNEPIQIGGYEDWLRYFLGGWRENVPGFFESTADDDVGRKCQKCWERAISTHCEFTDVSFY